MEIHKVLKNGPKNKDYTIISKKRTRSIQIYPQNVNFGFFKIPKKGAKPKI